MDPHTFAKFASDNHKYFTTICSDRGIGLRPVNCTWIRLYYCYYMTPGAPLDELFSDIKNTIGANIPVYIIYESALDKLLPQIIGWIAQNKVPREMFFVDVFVY